jgi:hypothetical protein
MIFKTPQVKATMVSMCLQIFSVCVNKYQQAWLEHLPMDIIHSWANFKRIFVGNFRGTCLRPRNSWNLKAYKKKAGETLREYIRRFFKQCNEIPDIVDADVIRAFISGMTMKH